MHLRLKVMEHCFFRRPYIWHFWSQPFSSAVHCTPCFCPSQQAANIVRALELFVKPDVLSGENAYMCAK